MTDITIDSRTVAARGRWAVAAMFLANGFIMGSWAPQIPLMLPRHDITEFTLGILILMFGLGAVVAASRLQRRLRIGPELRRYCSVMFRARSRR